jgi:16S rRNA (guanine527-N7)-methyltransferase
MDTARIAKLLRPFAGDAELTPLLLEQLQRYLDVLLRWNARINLTAVRDPEQVVTRHFGESLFAARVLFPVLPGTTTLADVGSGAGLPGIPIKLFAPALALTLIESHNKKATFLREVVRALELERAEVFCGRAEEWEKSADVVTMRAVEKFERTLPAVANLVAPEGRLCLMLGDVQCDSARALLEAGWEWKRPQPIPQSSGRVVLIAGRT